MNAMVQITQVKVFHYPTAPCQKCKTVHRYCEMFDANQVASTGRICRSCWDAYKLSSRNRTAARFVRQKQMELVA